MQLPQTEEKKWNLYSHARHKQSRESLSLAGHGVFNLALNELRQVNIDLLTLIEEKISFHRSKRGTFHAERASAYDVVLQELTQLLQDASERY